MSKPGQSGLFCVSGLKFNIKLIIFPKKREAVFAHLPNRSACGASSRLATASAQAVTEKQTLRGIRIAQQQFEDKQQVERLRKFHREKTYGCSMRGQALG
jgi:hypothetical protein